MSEYTMSHVALLNHFLTHKQAVTALRAPRTPRPATAAASPATSPATARPAAVAVASPALSATR
jgi:hypothetical protein